MGSLLELIYQAVKKFNDRMLDIYLGKECEPVGRKN